MKYRTKDFVLRCRPMLAARTSRATILVGLAVLLFLTSTPSPVLAQLPPKDCTVNGATMKAYLCLDDIVVVDGSGHPNTQGGISLVYPVTGDQTPISTAG